MTGDARRSPLAARPDLAASTGGVTLAEVPFLTMVDVRCDPVVVSEAGGVPLPGPGVAATAAGRSALWLGPDEWLLIGPDGDAGLLADVPGARSVVDVSANRTALRLRGPHAVDVLAKGCALDVAAAGPGWCAVTLLSRLNVVLWRQDDGFLILVRPSFAHYLADWLLDAAAEFCP